MLAKVLEAWSTPSTSSDPRRSKTDLTRYSRKRTSGRFSLDSHTTLREEERRTSGCETQRIPLFGIPLQGLAGGGIERNKARFSKLCLPNR